MLSPPMILFRNMVGTNQTLPSSLASGLAIFLLMRFRKARRRRMGLDYRAFDFFVQLPPITMLLQVLDSPASHIPIAPCRLGQAIGHARPSGPCSRQTRCCAPNVLRASYFASPNRVLAKSVRFMFSCQHARLRDAAVEN